MSHKKIFNGCVFGSWLVLESYSSVNRRSLCKCECGVIKEVMNTHLLSGKSSRCMNCYHKIIGLTSITHGAKSVNATPLEKKLYSKWKGMRGRTKCDTDRARKDRDHRNYLLRGITISVEWDNFINFFNDMSPTFFKGASLDRINNDKGYSKENCRWANNITQCNNKTNNHYITYNNKTMSMADWARLSGISYYALRTRINTGWSPEDAITKPIRKH